MSSVGVADVFMDYSIPGTYSDSSTAGLSAARRKPEQGLFSNWVVYPDSKPRLASTLQRQFQDIAGWTAWSNRRVAYLLNTTHPTVAAVLNGRGGDRARGLADRATEVHAVLNRLYRATDADSGELRRIITERPFTGGPSAIECLRSDEPAQALLAALDVLNGPPAAGLITGNDPVRGGDASVAVSREE